MFAKERVNRSGLKDCGMVNLSKIMKRGQKNKIGSRQRLNTTLTITPIKAIKMGLRTEVLLLLFLLCSMTITKVEIHTIRFHKGN
jgi:hypothetical protein